MLIDTRVRMQPNHYATLVTPRPITLRYLLSQAELRFYRELIATLDRTVGVAPKVRLADVIACVEKTPSVVTLGRISQKHLDFVLYERSTSRIIGAIELDDASHLKRPTARRDRFVNDLLRDTGLPLLRVRASRVYSREILREQLHKLSRRLATTRDGHKRLLHTEVLK
jgi:hypothetical protein